MAPRGQLSAVSPYARLVIGCVLLAVLARVGYVLVSWNFAPRIDNREYLERAVYLYNFHRLLPAVAAHRTFADVYWPPVFPLFLTLLVGVYHALHAVGLLGAETQSFASQHYAASSALGFIRFMRIAEGAVSALAVLPLISIACTLWGRRVALIAGLLFAVFPPLVYVSDSLYSESLFTPLLICAVAATLRYRREPQHRWRWLVLAGVLCGFAALTHSDGVALVPALLVGFWPRAERGSRAGSAPGGGAGSGPGGGASSGPGGGARLAPAALARFAPAAVFLLVTVLTISPWTIRNAIDLHAFVPISDSDGRTLAGVYNSYSANTSNVPAAFHTQFVNVAPFPRLFARYPLPDLARSTAQLHAAFDYIGAHPLYPLRVAYWNTVRILELTGGSGSEKSARLEGIDLAYAWVGDVAFWILGICALFGACSPAVRRAREKWIWLVPLFMYLAVVFISTDTPRFRAPIDPFLVLLAAVAIDGWWGALRPGLAAGAHSDGGFV